jgi:mono/diheme cytochrome c family protein
VRRLVKAFSLAAFLALAGCSLAEDVTPPPGLPVGQPDRPVSEPDIAAGATIYADRCAPCHGASGLGDGAQSANLPVPPARLGDPVVARAASLAEWYQMVTTGNLDRFMPGFQSLSDQQRWDVAAYALTLSTEPDEIERGREVYEANSCADCHAAGAAASFLSAGALAERSGEEILQVITDGTGEMPAFGDSLSEDEAWALVSYLRASGSAGAVASAPSATPESTEPTAPAPEGEVTSAEVTPALSLTPEPGATAQAPAGEVRGQVTNGTQGGPVEAGLEVTLRGVEGSEEVFRSRTQVGQGGEFAFEGVEVVPGRLFTVSVEYEGVTYESDPAHLVNGSPVLDLPLTVYETTSENIGLSVAQLHLILSTPQEGFVRAFEIWVFSNSGDRAVLPADGAPLLEVALPEGAVLVQLTGAEALGHSTESANAFLFSLGVPPGVGSAQMAVVFDAPFDGRLELSQTVEYPIDSVILLAEAGGLVPRGGGWTSLGPVDLAGLPVEQFSTEAPGVGETIDLTMVLSSEAGTSGSTLLGAVVGAAVLGVAVVFAGLWWYRRRGIAAADGEGVSPMPAAEPAGRESILRAIAALDDQSEAGTIDEEEYRLRRQALKERALDQLRGGRD